MLTHRRFRDIVLLNGQFIVFPKYGQVCIRLHGDMSNCRETEDDIDQKRGPWSMRLLCGGLLSCRSNIT